MDLPIYFIEISEDMTDDNGVNFVSIVDRPAIERNYLKFSEHLKFVQPNKGESETDFNARCIPVLINEGKEQDQAVAICADLWKTNKYMRYVTNDKQIVTGPAVIVDLPIYRKMDGKEFYTIFDKTNTERLIKKWAVNQKYNAVNADHETPVKSMYLFESYVIDRERGINPPKGFEDVPDGSWFLSYYVQDSALWDKIKAGEFNGFSVEGLFGLTGQSELSAVADFIEEIKEFRATI